MAYCVKCGAYVPDGHRRCLACGYDEAAANEKKETKKGGGADYAFGKASFKEELERQRRVQQERSRRWAEQEAERRRQGRGSGENNGAKNDSGDFGEFHAEPNRLLSALSYLSVLFILPFLLCPNDPFARFHANQGAVLFGFGVLADVVGKIIPIGWVLTLFRLYCIYKGMSSALAGRREPLPYIGRFGMM